MGRWVSEMKRENESGRNRWEKVGVRECSLGGGRMVGENTLKFFSIPLELPVHQLAQFRSDLVRLRKEEGNRGKLIEREEERESEERDSS